MPGLVILEWTFSPPDYFEEPVEVVRASYTMSIRSGKVEAKIDVPVFDSDSSMQQQLQAALAARFEAVQLLTHKLYELSGPTLIRVRPDGTRDIFVQLTGATVTLTGGSVDFRATNTNGEVVIDTRRERIDRKRDLADLVATHRASDKILASLLSSYGSGVRDPNNELVHLYEIKEALSSKFGGDANARALLSIGASHWSAFGRLCNREPLRQGRHRGTSVGALRDATESELAEARAIAKGMIEAYLRYLDAQAATKPNGVTDRGHT